MYAAYNNQFYGAISKELKVQTSFEKLSNTDWWEQYMVNAFQFSAAKNATEMRLLQQNIFDEKGNRRSMSDFKNLAENQSILEKFNGPDWWLNTEYELAVRGAVMAENWKEMYKDKDLYPYYIYQTMDSPCEICEPLDGMIFRFDDMEAEDIYPPNHFNCYCTVEQTDEAGENEEDLATKEDLEDVLDNIPEQFRGNVGADGIFPKEGSSYYETLPNANSADSEMFNSSVKEKELLNTTKYNSYAVELTWKEWNRECLKPSKGKSDDILFRNHEWMLNVRLTHEMMIKIGNKSRGVENLRHTVEHPSEIFAKWVDIDKQKEVHMFYLSHDEKDTFIVETKSGIIIDAYLRKHNDAKLKRKIGIKLMK